MSPFAWVLLFALLGACQAYYINIQPRSGGQRPLNDQEKMMLEDLNQSGPGKRGLDKLFGRNGGIKKPKCYFEDFTASCCVQMKYRTIDPKGKIKPQFHRACIEAGVTPSQLKIFVRAYYDTINLNNGTTNTHEIINAKKYFGKLCWNLPPPVDLLEQCVWLYHVNISFNEQHPKAEMCLAFIVTNQLRMQLDCLNWEDGVFSLNHDHDIPEPGLVTLHAGKDGFRFEVKVPNAIKKTWKAIKETWNKTKQLFSKTTDHIKFLFKKADN